MSPVVVLAGWKPCCLMLSELFRFQMFFEEFVWSLRNLERYRKEPKPAVWGSSKLSTDGHTVSDSLSLSSPWVMGSFGNSHLHGLFRSLLPALSTSRRPCCTFWTWAGNPVISPSLLTFSYQISSLVMAGKQVPWQCDQVRTQSAVCRLFRRSWRSGSRSSSTGLELGLGLGSLRGILALPHPHWIAWDNCLTPFFLSFFIF